jgi:hypothetical protein
MSLFNAYYQKKVLPQKAEKNQYVQLFKNRVDRRSYEKTVRILEGQILEQNPSMSSALTFSMVCLLVGEDSQCPSGDAKYVRELVKKAAQGHPKTYNYILGTLAQMCFARDTRPWYCSKKPTGKINPEGEEIDVTIYWVRPEDA